ncbi:energy-coupling factor transport system ATP-binding protein [Staphylococcus pasteuri]|uniref:Energy-coupling factor transport system ATP-binding protein n=3 Tax=Staphylococcus TaxID=1279 RepID=A0ABY1H2D7_9STAP|nr:MULTISPECIES: ABC transporter ATP-binding protein [Staphylococcus]KKI57027.1 ATPase component YkoD [Staphylococcus pasteuri]MCF7598788.1 energy-coupling factor ABC transporter ATP-binding protein [Staphylococcus pasteuri]MDI3231159.1 ABC transporter ATP-binding protein [Staphylococcus pasteuri]MDO6574110.1 ABC transporter ATP-binding protein [Staphylococcus pasteuri_A]MEB6208390.1 energy-coupling factor ABC transporter ATP-binding protein [Staphylococcus pasteuri]
MLKVTNLRLKYPNGHRKIFDDLNLEIKDKEKVLLLGPSGSGKSTLLHVLSGIVPKLIELPMKYDTLEINDHNGVIFQDPDTQFCMPKVYEELAFVLENRQLPRKDMDEAIENALNSVNLNVNETTQINHLSGGMKQKLAIVETILQQADTLFLDEPTAMLDVEATEDLWQRLIDLWQDQTVLIVEHKVEHIWQHVDRVLLMNYEGQIIADGSPEHILQHFEHLLSEYGVWHPKAWNYAPEPKKITPSTQQQLFKFNDGEILRSKKTLFKVDQLSINSGEWITITGKNGTGKTSLLESILQLIKYKGIMTYQNQELHKIKDASQHMYLVYQNPELQFITNSVYEEIFIHYNHLDSTHADEKTLQLLELLNLTNVKNQHPYEISMGQKRRLSVATALSSDADIILLDEPTFGLDSHNTFQLIELFQERVSKGQSIIMVTHDPEIIKRYPTRRWAINNKQLTEIEGEQHV